MAKKVTRIGKIQIEGGAAKPGAALASFGINMPQFCNAFNEATKNRKGEQVPVIITAYNDKSFDFVIKKAPLTSYLLKAVNAKKGSAKPNSVKIGKINVETLTKIAEEKMEDFNTTSLNSAINTVAGAAKSLGIEIEGNLPSNNDKEMHLKFKKEQN
ncbi:hypothetical protein ASO20_01755 [Mycoplasma sp. (ex Biomphalaria glabrata)]|uniref:50S ribosomal protein L11 n=1 Tax=Mycoplasma sp. (ex Biomphalaria glabrata) TaxID=1749074 RepID=UPI00073ABE27|nr:50S ribosomal protein L11 [Mycoplasma sp. (ex Biomphalaria glabrata)]ALV23373.1 hypothetical protein ASO20_01755 [Mycoplasma sp. (ex Biomphalaria glabrata)]